MSMEEIIQKVNQYKDPELRVLITFDLIGEEISAGDLNRINTLLALEGK